MIAKEFWGSYTTHPLFSLAPNSKLSGQHVFLTAFTFLERLYTNCLFNGFHLLRDIRYHPTWIKLFVQEKPLPGWSYCNHASYLFAEFMMLQWSLLDTHSSFVGPLVPTSWVLRSYRPFSRRATTADATSLSKYNPLRRWLCKYFILFFKRATSVLPTLRVLQWFPWYLESYLPIELSMILGATVQSNLFAKWAHQTRQQKPSYRYICEINCFDQDHLTANGKGFNGFRKPILLAQAV